MGMTTGHPPLLTPADFDVEQCVAHYYPKPDGRHWWWHCLTCNTSTQVRKHGKGHASEASAAEGMREHVCGKAAQRRAEAWRSHWWGELLTTPNATYFVALWYQMYPADRALALDGRIDEIMARVQRPDRPQPSILAPRGVSA